MEIYLLIKNRNTIILRIENNLNIYELIQIIKDIPSLGYDIEIYWNGKNIKFLKDFSFNMISKSKLIYLNVYMKSSNKIKKILNNKFSLIDSSILNIYDKYYIDEISLTDDNIDRYNLFSFLNKYDDKIVIKKIKITRKNLIIIDSFEQIFQIFLNVLYLEIISDWNLRNKNESIDFLKFYKLKHLYIENSYFDIVNDILKTINNIRKLELVNILTHSEDISSLYISKLSNLDNLSLEYKYINEFTSILEKFQFICFNKEMILNIKIDSYDINNKFSFKKFEDYINYPLSEINLNLSSNFEDYSINKLIPFIRRLKLKSYSLFTESDLFKLMNSGKYKLKLLIIKNKISYSNYLFDSIVKNIDSDSSIIKIDFNENSLFYDKLGKKLNTIFYTKLFNTNIIQYYKNIFFDKIILKNFEYYNNYKNKGRSKLILNGIIENLSLYMNYIHQVDVLELHNLEYIPTCIKDLRNLDELVLKNVKFNFYEIDDILKSNKLKKITFNRIFMLERKINLYNIRKVKIINSDNIICYDNVKFIKSISLVNVNFIDEVLIMNLKKICLMNVKLDSDVFHSILLRNKDIIKSLKLDLPYNVINILYNVDLPKLKEIYIMQNFFEYNRHQKENFILSDRMKGINVMIS